MALRYSDIKPVSTLYSDEMLRAIAGLFLACAAAEHVLRLQLARLHHHAGYATVTTVTLLAGMEVKVMLEKITIGAMLAKPRYGKEIADLCDKIRAGFDRRNDIAHNSAIAGSGDNLRLGFVRLYGSGKYVDEKRMTTKQVEEVTSRLYDNVRHLTEQLTAIGITRLPKVLERSAPAPEDAPDQTQPASPEER